MEGKNNMDPLRQCGGLALDPTSTLSYFEVNSTYPATSSNHANSISVPCNYVDDISLVAWTHNGNIYYKTTPYLGGTGFAFRKSPAGVASTTATGVLNIYPNPASDALTVDNPADVAADR